ncbi:MAG: hypothetical protein KJ587_10775 [Alphaproteobacteria bacterium]|nr:hypothetical protein [Alphaproteobacteria bacterium]
MMKHGAETHAKIDNEASASAPGDPGFKSWINHPRTVARLQILVIVLGIVVIAGFATVIGRIAYLTLYQSNSDSSASVATDTRTMRIAVPPATAALEQRIELPPGAIVEDLRPMSDGSLMVRFRDARGTGMMVFDADSGALRRHWRFVPAAN